MKLRIITTAALLTLGSTLSLSSLRAEDAPPPPPAGEHPGRGPGKGGQNLEQRLKQLGELLQLTDAQKAQLTPIIKAEIAEMQAVRKDDTLDRAAKAEKVKAIREAYKPKIRSVLTPEQVTKLETWEKDHPGMGRGPKGERGERKGPPPADKE